MKKVIIHLLVILILAGCLNNSRIRREGFSSGKLTVYVYEFIPENRENTDERIMKILREKLDYRALMLMACYVSIHLERNKISKTNDNLLNKAINETLASANILYFSCDDSSYCEAAAEYDAGELLQTLELINNQ